MRYNELEVKSFLRSSVANLEGNLVYIDPKEGPKKRKARLVNSILALYKYSPMGVYVDADPSEIVMLSNIQVNQSQSVVDGLDIVCLGVSAYTIHSFRCQSPRDLVAWYTALRSLSYTAMSEECVKLQKDILQAKIKVSSQRYAADASGAVNYSLSTSSLPPPPVPRRATRARGSTYVPTRVAPTPPPSRPPSDEKTETLLIDFS